MHVTFVINNNEQDLFHISLATPTHIPQRMYFLLRTDSFPPHNC